MGPPRFAFGRDAAGAALATVALATLASLFILRPFSPTFPEPGLDASWAAVLGEAAARGARWGVDLAFTYGPASALVSLFAAGDYVMRTLPILLGSALAFGAAATALIWTASPPGRRVPVLLVATAALVLSRCSRDGFFLVLPLLTFLSDLRRPAGFAAATLTAAIAFATGLGGLAKMTAVIASLPVYALGDAYAARHRRPPLLLAGFLAGFGGGLMLYGQHLADLPAFLRLQGSVAAGYADAMAVDGPAWELLPFLLVEAALLFGAGAAARDRAERIVMVSGLGWGLFVLFKAGFVRHDLHVPLACEALAFAVALIAGALILPSRPRLGSGLVLAAAVLGLLLVPFFIVRSTPRPERQAVLGRLLREGFAPWPGQELAGFAATLRDPAGRRAALDAKRQAAWAAVAQDDPLPRLEGSVDIIPSRQNALMASGNEYRPRPSFQSYSTYTPSLIEANRAFIDSEHGPHWILFGPEFATGRMGIDNRFPGFTEGGLWVDLIRRYRPERQIGDLVALHRRPAPLADPLVGAARKRSARFGEAVPVDGSSPVLARLVVRPTWLGRVAGLLFHPPILTLAVTPAVGPERPFRFVPALGAAGFVLSPLVFDATDFAALATGKAELLAPRTVRAFRLIGPPISAWFYERQYEIEFRRLEVAPEDAPVPVRATGWDALKVASPTPLAGDVVPVAIPGEITVPTLSSDRLTFGYGLEGRAEKPDAKVCFAAVAADGSGTVAWRTCLGPSDADGNLRTASIALPPGTSEVVLQTRCIGRCDGLDAFWGNPAPAP